MSDVPSLGEVVRRLDQIQQLLSRVVYQDVYLAEQRAVERRFADIERTSESAVRGLVEDLRELRASIDKAAERRGSNMRQNVYSVVIPSVIFLVSVLVQIYLAARGNL
jgi:hypothetical protein